MSTFIPDGSSEETALRRTTHLGIGAHPDDLEIMGLHGILAAYQSADNWFGGITCTNGSGSIREGDMEGIELSSLTARRKQEQVMAAQIGQYSFITQLGLDSAAVLAAPQDTVPIQLHPLLKQCRPQVVYTHNPADKHPTHIAVLKAVLHCYRSLPPENRPRRIYGCEVWRNLDWLCDEKKVVLEINDPQHLASRLMAVYQSQIGAGKQYDKAIEGRRRANATFFQAQNRDISEEAIYAIDLTPLIWDEQLTLTAFIAPFLEAFRNEVLSALQSPLKS